MTEQIQEGDIVLCTVDRIVGTNVFVHIEDNGEGTIMFSEVAPGRIRNIRNYVVPKKKIVCKVLRISGKNVELSLRRVTQQEKKDRLEEYNQEKKYKSMLKSVLEEKADSVIEKIQKKKKIYDFFEKAKQKPEILEKYLTKKDAEKIHEILSKQKPKKSLVKKQISLKTKKPNGLELIKNLLGNLKEINTKYISAGNYVLEIESENLKKADNKLKETIQNIEKNAKKQNILFSLTEK